MGSGLSVTQWLSFALLPIPIPNLLLYLIYIYKDKLEGNFDVFIYIINREILKNEYSIFLKIKYTFSNVNRRYRYI